MEVEALGAHEVLEDHGQELHQEEDHGSDH
jgi:hypothetical protein